MSRPLFLLGLGGFGKWTVTGFKKEILDIYGHKPSDVDWLAIDLIGEETPLPQYTRFEAGKLKQEMLDYSENSEEFMSFHGNYTNEIQNIKAGEEDNRFRGRMSQNDASLIISDIAGGGPGAERRHVSMLQFVLDIDNLKKVFNNKLQSNSMIFVVSSWAGGTGAGIFLDCLLLLRNLMMPLGGNLFTINLLPQGFEKVKENEDMGPNYGNCFATFREFLRLYFPKGNTKVHYSLHDLDFQDISKPKGVDVLSDLAFIVDGSSIAGQKGANIHYYRGTVPSIVTFITNSFLATSHEEQEVQAGTKNQTSFDQGKTHTTANLTHKDAKENPFNAFSFASFGSYRLIYDSKAIKTEFAQKIASDIFSHKYFQAPSWIPDIEFYVKEYMTNISECTKFDKEVVHDCITKGHQISNFANFNNLKNKLEEEVKFPEFNISSIKPKGKGKLKDTNDLINHRVNNIKGTVEDKYNARGKPTFYAVHNYYYDYYTSNFAENVQKKTLEILNNGKGTDDYGKGNLKAAESFIKIMKIWYTRFIRGFPETNEKAAFHLVCDITDQTEGIYADWQGKVDQYYKDNQKKGKTLLGDPSKEYLKMKEKLNNLEIRDLKRKLIRDIAEENLTYLEKLHEKINVWIETFKECHDTVQEGLDNLLEVRSSKKNIVSDEYLTNSGDVIESRMYDMVTNNEAYNRIKTATTGLDEIDSRFKEVVNKIPDNKWADFLKGFTWAFNIPDESGNLFSEQHAPNDLVCSVDAKMPDFPINGAQDQKENILIWNYKLVEYYLTEHKLDELDEISAFEVLMLRKDDPKGILSELKRKSSLMLFYNDTTEVNLKNKGYCNHPPENHYSVIADFGYSDKQIKLKNFIDTFNTNMTATTKKQSITVADERNKPHEIVFLSSRFCLPAPAMQNLYGTRPEYLKRMDKNVPPPLHIFKGEKEAYKNEVQVSKTFRTSHEELHPQVVSILESEVEVQGTNMLFIRSFLWANILGMIKKDGGEISDKKSYYIELEEKEYLGSDTEWPLFSDVIYNLIYNTAQEHELRIKSIIEGLNKKIEDALSKMSDSEKEKLRNEKAEEYKEIIKKKELPKREEDLYKVWMIILNSK